MSRLLYNWLKLSVNDDVNRDDFPVLHYCFTEKGKLLYFILDGAFSNTGDRVQTDEDYVKDCLHNNKLDELRRYIATAVKFCQ
jgi:hypothetical protein